jgi:DNA-binding NtrC family response regulator
VGVPAQSGAAVLAVVASDEDRHALERMFTGAGWRFHHALDCDSALRLIEELAIPVVLCDTESGSFCWRELHTRAGGPDAPALIIASRCADDRLWAEVLNLGGFDVLAKPFERQEVLWAARTAWEEWQARRQQRAAAAAAG